MKNLSTAAKEIAREIFHEQSAITVNACCMYYVIIFHFSRSIGQATLMVEIG